MSPANVVIGGKRVKNRESVTSGRAFLCGQTCAKIRFRLVVPTHSAFPKIFKNFFFETLDNRRRVYYNKNS